MCMKLTGRGFYPLGKISLSIPGLAQGTTCLGCAPTMLALLGLPLLTRKTIFGSVKQVCAGFAQI